MLICAICGCAYLPAKPWDSDWCPTCASLNFAALEIQPPTPPSLGQARQALDAYVTAPVTTRQRHAMHRLLERWAEEEGRA